MAETNDILILTQGAEHHGIEYMCTVCYVL